MKSPQVTEANNYILRVHRPSPDSPRGRRSWARIRNSRAADATFKAWFKRGHAIVLVGARIMSMDEVLPIFRNDAFQP